ncbi:MAG: hypothetical protein DMF69_04350 [Acidobacteria bacterium]|nr:MAG: hypothetical protein DMF69_04350 [Acidobacteriota bacterium]
MKHQVSFFSVLLLSLSLTSGSAPRQFSNTLILTSVQEEASADKLVYADFEKVENGRPVSNNGGLVQVYTGQESTPVKFKGLANASPGAPELVRVKPNDPNHLASFEYSLVGPNQWANVTLEIQGHPSQNGQTKADDVSGYKHLSLQLYATGVDSLRVEFISHGQGIELQGGYPQLPIRLKPGLNTYLIPLKGLTQPTWQQDRIDTKTLMKKLTAISISTYCNECTPQLGTVVVDNLVFQK